MNSEQVLAMIAEYNPRPAVPKVKNDPELERKGCAVPDESLRSGRRSLKKDGTDAKLKARSRQRIDTQKAAPLHPDCAEARRTFLARFK